MLIRFATEHDAPDITENTIQLAWETEKLTLNRGQVEQGVKKIIKRNEKGLYIVAEESNKLIGQAMITFEWSDWRNCEIWWLQSIFIKKKYRKKGVMRQLVSKIREMAFKQEVFALRLYVHKKNMGAIASYEKIGMEKSPYLIYSYVVDEDSRYASIGLSKQ